HRYAQPKLRTPGCVMASIEEHGRDLSSRARKRLHGLPRKRGGAYTASHVSAKALTRLPKSPTGAPAVCGAKSRNLFVIGRSISGSIMLWREAKTAASRKPVSLGKNPRWRERGLVRCHRGSFLPCREDGQSLQRRSDDRAVRWNDRHPRS